MNINKKIEVESLDEKLIAEDLTTTFRTKLAKKAEDGKVHIVDDVHDLNQMLDLALDANIAQLRNLEPGEQYQPLNILIIGDAGTGKSSIVSKWIRDKEVMGKKLRKVKFNGSQLNPDVVQGVGHAVHKTDEEGKDIDYADYLNFKVFDKLQPTEEDVLGSVLFIDELNRSYEAARAALLDMITSHSIADNNAAENTRYLDKWIMTVAAINPPDAAHRGAELLDLAMLTRFYIFEWKSSIKGTRSYLIQKLEANKRQSAENLATGHSANGWPYTEKEYEEDQKSLDGMIHIVKKLFTPEIAFDSGETLKSRMKEQKNVVNARTLEDAVWLSKGNPDLFIKLAPGALGAEKDSPLYNKIKLALASEDESTDTDLEFKKKTMTAYDRLMDFEDEI